MYGKIFESMYDGTLSADWKAMVTFQQFIVLADKEGVVDYTPPALSRRTGIPLHILEHGIAKLQEPDKYSRSAEMEGRRIVLLDDHRPWGWFIVNYEAYAKLANKEDRREQDRERKRKQRAKSLNQKDVRSCPQASAMSRHVDVDVDIDVDKTDGRETYVSAPRKTKPKKIKLTDELAAYGKSKGMPELTISGEWEKFSEWEFRTAKTDWKRTWQRWVRTWAERQPKTETLMFGAFDD